MHKLRIKIKLKWQLFLRLIGVDTTPKFEPDNEPDGYENGIMVR